MAEPGAVAVYRPPGWDAVHTLFSGLDQRDARTVGLYLEARAERLLQGWLARDEAAIGIVTNWHPELVGDRAAASVHPADHDAAAVTVAREHGFADWGAVEAAAARTVDRRFESAVDHLLAGERQPLSSLLADHPGLVTQRSSFGHRATLLHYLAANGVETERQVTPLNAAAMVELLVAAGADPAAEMPVYGGFHTTLELARTSAHPRAAGVLPAMVAALDRS